MATGGSSRGSYRYHLVNQPPHDVVCPICLDILVDPHQLTCCGQHLCKECSKKVNQACPLCRRRTYQVVPDKYFERNTLNCLQVYCREKDEGCQMKGDLSKLRAHMKDCEYRKEKCPLKCGKSYQRCLIKTHVSFDCVQRPHECRYCGYESTYAQVTGAHARECAKIPVSCPNKCGSKSRIVREGLSDHINNDCPLQMVPCSFDNVCQMTVPRKDLPQHCVKYAQYHTALLTKKISDETLKMLQEKDKEMAKKEDRYITMLHQLMKEKDEQMREKDKQIKLLEERLATVLMCSNNFIEIDGFSKKKGRWFSLPYYICGGYKMCLAIDIDCCKPVVGVDEFGYIEEGYLCINHYMMRGPFDDTLQWPFTGKIIVRVVGFEEFYDYEFDYSSATEKEGDQVTDCSGSDRGPLYSCTSGKLFAEELSYSYIADDTLKLQVMAI